jgi:SAM-dependent methyltransferase
MNDQLRRRNPRFFDHDWLVMRGVTRAVTELSEKTAKGGTAIDFGCGSMPYADLFTARGTDYIGADFDTSGDIRISSKGKLPATTESADTVLSFQVLEHVRDLDTYFAEARRVLKPNGRMILSTHGTWLYHPHPEDHRRWTRQGLQHDIESRGFKVVEWRAVVGPLAWTTVFRLIGFRYGLLKIPLIGAPVAGLLAIVMNARAYIEDKITPREIADNNACIYVMLCKPAGKKASRKR